MGLGSFFRGVANSFVGGAGNAGGAVVGAVSDVKDGLSDLGDSIADGASNAYDVLSGDRDRRWNAEQAELNRMWQERMNSTEIQRRMADMAAAGLNPMMAGEHSAGTPSGSVAAPVDGAGKADAMLDKALRVVSLTSQIKNVDSQTAKNLADADNTRGLHQGQKDLLSAQERQAWHQGGLNNALENFWSESSEKIRHEIAKIGKDMQLTDAQIALVQNQAVLTKAEVRSRDALTASTAEDVRQKKVHSEWLESPAGKWDAGSGNALRQWIRSIIPGGTVAPVRPN